LYVSTIDLYKHHQNVAQAVVNLQNSGFPVTLDLVGEAYPAARKNLEAALARIDPRREIVRYRGPAPFGTLQAIYHDSDAFVFASSCENLPNILIEAMASGLPIACSSRGPMPEVLGDGGLYFDPENARAVTEALKHLITNPELRMRFALTAYRRAERYSWTKCADLTLAFLRTIASRVKGSGTPVRGECHSPHPL
jgi:glycosyltransferase involved in cell wall biosynthesis